MRYGFVIDQRKCIGCHACTVACKEEHDVPLGVFRTWVKYIERGAFPATRRYFSVLRCNHCDNAPCVTICPTVALFRRSDGIVDFDGSRCIGCKSCMQACPYDALYIDPNSNTAAKCNYCAHRVEVGLQPACVVVCPEEAIIAGDLDDPATLIARLVATEQVQVRKPEQGTVPKLFYVGADAASLAPALQQPADAFMWSEGAPGARGGGARSRGSSSTPHGLEADGAAASRTVYDAPHAARPWGRKVSAYLWTKSISAGTALVASIAVLAGAAAGGPITGVVVPIVALAFLAITSALLVLDLKRPDRFLFILTKPNWRSWLVLGTVILLLFGAAMVAWLVAGLTGRYGALPSLAPIVALLAAAAAGYSAFLFAQAEGRDFWQSPLVLPHLLAAALVAGAATMVVVHAFMWRGLAGVFYLLMLGVGLTGLGLVHIAEHGGRHAGVDAARAARLITHGPWRTWYWGGAVAAGIVAPLALLRGGGDLAIVAAGLALAGLWIYEEIWIAAGQAVPLS